MVCIINKTYDYYKGYRWCVCLSLSLYVDGSGKYLPQANAPWLTTRIQFLLVVLFGGFAWKPHILAMCDENSLIACGIVCHTFVIYIKRDDYLYGLSSDNLAFTLMSTCLAAWMGDTVMPSLALFLKHHAKALDRELAPKHSTFCDEWMNANNKLQ